MQLARNKLNGQLVAIKFLERGPDKVQLSFQIASHVDADKMSSDLALHPRCRSQSLWSGRSLTTQTSATHTLCNLKKFS